MKKIELTIWNSKEEKASYDVPRFVIDEHVTDFENLCQRYYDRAKAFELSNTTAKKLASLEKTLKNANMTMKMSGFTRKRYFMTSILSD